MKHSTLRIAFIFLFLTSLAMFAQDDVCATEYDRSITPNPTLHDFTVNYNSGSANSAFITITNVITGISDNYLLDVSKTYKTINISNKPTGQYIISLVTDNVIVDTKQLIKN